MINRNFHLSGSAKVCKRFVIPKAAVPLFDKTTVRNPGRGFSVCQLQFSEEATSRPLLVLNNGNSPTKGEDDGPEIQASPSLGGTSTLTAAERAIFEQIYEDAAHTETRHTQTEEVAVQKLIQKSLDKSRPPEALSSTFDRAADILKENHRHNLSRSILDSEQNVENHAGRAPPELSSSYPASPVVADHLLNSGSSMSRPSAFLEERSKSIRPDSQIKQRGSPTADERGGLPHAYDNKNSQASRASTEDTILFNRLLSSAVTDVQVWEVLRDHVFLRVRSFMENLRSEKVEPDISRPSRLRPSKTGLRKSRPFGLLSVQALAVATGSGMHTHLAAPFAVIRTNYAHHCWAAMRKLRQHFPRSPYATAILPTIKSIGPISYVLGSSTELYNELLFLRWVHYRDLHACSDILDEMLDRGVPTNEGTRAVFRAAAQQWLQARGQSKLKERGADSASATDCDLQSGADLKTSSDNPTDDLQPFALAWWSLEGTKSGFKRWQTLEIEAQKRFEEEQERRDRKILEIGDDDLDGPQPKRKQDWRQKVAAARRRK